MEPRFIFHEPPRRYSEACICGDLIFLAGEDSKDPTTQQVQGNTVAEQVEYLFRNMKTTLESLGSSLNSVVKTTVYLKDPRDRGNYQAARAKYLPQTPPSTLIMGVQLDQASGIETPTREDLARLDRKRKHKGSNDDWTHPQDPDAKITKMKDGRTHLAHKAEHAVDLETGAVVGVTVQGADQGDTTTSKKTLIEAAEQIEAVVPDSEGPKEVVADKGYHSNQALVDLEAVGVRSYISEPDRGRRNRRGNPEAQNAVYRNRRRIGGVRGKRLLRQRGELLERPFAHLYETGAMRRVYLLGHQNILKRILLHAAALNLVLLMRTLFGVGTPRSLQGRVAAVFIVLWSS